jgi:hypothetical protein
MRLARIDGAASRESIISPTEPGFKTPDHAQPDKLRYLTARSHRHQ